ncbi:universal stress protein [Nocardioides insulae]|uniref:universal stress protein n=1 Tax=Nocardioides insulae TaxID=394734 RepID=UPI0004167F7B|nr:universal stress protein [Nocardioides insulae]
MDTILVGVDGSHADRTSLRYATEVALRTGADIRIAHVATTYSALVPVVDVDFEDYGREVLDGAMAVARESIEATRLSGILLRGQRQPALLEAAKDVNLVVLGASHRGRMERLVTGSTTTALAAGAHCPVVVVPDTWEGNHHGAVGVGVKTLEGAVPLLAQAAAIAESRRAVLEVLHAWHLPVSAYDVMSVPGAIDTSAWESDMRDALAGEVRQALVEHPTVEVRQTVVEANPATMLADLGGRIDLLVVARRAKRFPRGHLGGTARALLREATCPVFVVPPPAGDEECPTI